MVARGANVSQCQTKKKTIFGTDNITGEMWNRVENYLQHGK
jgi:hypothetical protein